jgi:hypothetical protein
MDKIHSPRNAKCNALSLGPLRIKIYALKLGALFIYSPVNCAFLEVATHRDEEWSKWAVAIWYLTGKWKCIVYVRRANSNFEEQRRSIIPPPFVARNPLWLALPYYCSFTTLSSVLSIPVIGWDTMLQAGRSRVRVLMTWIFFSLPNLSNRTMTLGRLGL